WSRPGAWSSSVPGSAPESSSRASPPRRSERAPLRSRCPPGRSASRTWASWPGRSAEMARIAHLIAESGAGYAQKMRAGRHELTADEPRTNGGTDTGPSPYSILLASLGACTSITLRMYAQRKGWELGNVRVELDFHKEEAA